MACLEEVWGVIFETTSPDKRANSLATDYLPVMALLPLCQIDLAKDTDPRASCSDAAETGGVCVSKSLTARGRARLQEAKAFVRGVVADSLVLVEHCGGIGAARRALEILGVRPGGHLLTEVLKPAIRVQLEAYPGVVCCGNLEDFSAAKF